MHIRAAALALTATLVPFAAYAQDPPPTPPEAQAQDAGGGRGGGAPDPQIRPYDRVITKEAKSDEGVFTVHRIKDRLYYEIPKSAYGKEFLWVSQIAKTTLGAGYGGQAAGNRVVRWERRGDRILLRSVSYDVVADAATPIARAVKDSNYDSILMAFNIAALGKDDAAVIDVTRLFTTDVPEFSGRTRVRARTFDASRSFVERAVSFPENVEVEATHTYNNPPDQVGGGAPAPAGRGAPPVRPGSASVVMHYSMVLLPAKPMQARLFDERVGYFSVSQMDYGKDEHRAPERRYITRYRLEKKDPNAELSEPIKPIVYWIDPATPTKWVPYLKKGIESWQPAFEAAGFKNAIIAKEAPSPEQDPDWSPEDARYWCGVAREWQVADLRISRFCAEPLTAFTERDALFPVASGALSNEELQSILSRINQLVVDLHEDPRSFPLNIALGRTYARLAEHYLATGQTDLARPAVSQAAAIRSKLVASDSSSPVVLNFQRRVDTLEKSLNAP